MMPITVLIADDHSIIRYGLAGMINSTEGFEVVAEATHAAEALSLYKQFNPTITFLDISMPDMTGIDACKEIIKLDPRALVIIMSMHLNETYLNNVLEAGAFGYMLKNSSKDDIINSMKKVVGGEKVFSDAVSELMTQSYLKGKSGKHAELKNASVLTRREKEILKLVISGKTNQEIGKLLFISPRTVETHRANLMGKLNVNNTAALVRLSLEMNLV